MRLPGTARLRSVPEIAPCVNKSQLSGMIYAAVQKIALGYGQSLIFLFCEG